MCDSSRILMSPRLGSEKDEEEVHKNEFHYYFFSSSSFILDSYFGFFKLEETLVEGCYTWSGNNKNQGHWKRDEMPIFQGTWLFCGNWQVIFALYYGYKFEIGKVVFLLSSIIFWNLLKIWLNDRYGLFFSKWMNGWWTDKDDLDSVVKLDKIYEKHRRWPSRCKLDSIAAVWPANQRPPGVHILSVCYVCVYYHHRYMNKLFNQQFTSHDKWSAYF